MARRIWPRETRRIRGYAVSPTFFDDRREAGKVLAKELSEQLAGDRDVLVLGLPRGGVAVAEPIAEALDAELDVMVVRKVGAPYQRELAVGALAAGGIRVIDQSSVKYLGIDREQLDELIAVEEKELQRRERVYRAGRGPLRIADRTVVLVDDGIATGSTMLVAIRALRTLAPRRIVVAVPIGPADVIDQFESVADSVVCLETPDPFIAIGAWYDDFHPMSDDEVRAILEASRSRRQ